MIVKQKKEIITMAEEETLQPIEPKIEVVKTKKIIKTIKTKMTLVEGKPFVRLSGWGIFLETTSKKENAGLTGDVIIRYEGEITPQKLDCKIISWELC